MAADNQHKDTANNAAKHKRYKLRVEGWNAVLDKAKGAEQSLPRPCKSGGHFTDSLSSYQLVFSLVFMLLNISVKKPGKKVFTATTSRPMITTATMMAPMVLVARSP